MGRGELNTHVNLIYPHVMRLEYIIDMENITTIITSETPIFRDGYHLFKWLAFFPSPIHGQNPAVETLAVEIGVSGQPSTAGFCIQKQETPMKTEYVRPDVELRFAQWLFNRLYDELIAGLKGRKLKLFHLLINVSFYILDAKTHRLTSMSNLTMLETLGEATLMIPCFRREDDDVIG